MGGLYNMLFGKNPASTAILATAGLTQGDVGRFRDCWVEKAEDGSYRIAVYTRNGGGNRECYHDEGEDSSGCTGCFMDTVSSLPGYLSDRDDEYDSTYATIYLALPEKYADDLKAIAEEKPVDMSETWTALIASLDKVSVQQSSQVTDRAEGTS